MVLVVYKGSYISVSDRFLFKKRFYFDICIGFIPIFSNGNYISLVWELYIFGLGIYIFDIKYRFHSDLLQKSVSNWLKSDIWNKVSYKMVISLFCLFVNIKWLYFDNIEIVQIFLKTRRKYIEIESFFSVSFRDFQISYRIESYCIESNLIVSNRNRIVLYRFSVSIFQSRPCLGNCNI